MADTKISALTALTSPADTDVLPIVDGTGPTTKKVALSNLTAGRNVSASQFTSTVGIGTAPFVVTSTTNVANLNASSLNGATFANPGPIGTTPSSGAFTTLSASNTVSGAGFSTYLASPPAIGGTLPSTGRFTSATLTTGGADIQTAGQGVNFSGNTGAAGKTSSTLTWYEEGTWTPGITSTGGGTVTLTSPTNSMHYTRVGRLVTITGQITVSSVSTVPAPSGDIKITGIPFPISSGKISSGATQVANMLNSPTSGTYTVLALPATATDGVYLHGMNAGTERAAQAPNLQANSTITITLTYLA